MSTTISEMQERLAARHATFPQPMRDLADWVLGSTIPTPRHLFEQVACRDLPALLSAVEAEQEWIKNRMRFDPPSFTLSRMGGGWEYAHTMLLAYIEERRRELLAALSEAADDGEWSAVKFIEADLADLGGQ